MIIQVISLPYHVQCKRTHSWQGRHPSGDDWSGKIMEEGKRYIAFKGKYDFGKNEVKLFVLDKDFIWNFSENHQIINDLELLQKCVSFVVIAQYNRQNMINETTLIGRGTHILV